jgi:hypothetical protein
VNESVIIEGPRIYRATIHPEELLENGFDPFSEDNGWNVLVRILKAKGLPEWCWADGADFCAEETPEGIVLEYKG